MTITEFLNRLDLDQDADERAIKRAYARELKKIDQETDAAGFQVLREAYELAVHWVKHKPANVSFAPAAVAPVALVLPGAARAADTGENPALLAQAVFDVFLGLCREMVARGNARDAALWCRHLRRCANDDRLLNLAARANFEYLIARLLAEGWQAGHEGLFVAARQVFGWDKDRRRLTEFGQSGGLLNQAIDECVTFKQQDKADCVGQEEAVARLRDPAEPSPGELFRHLRHLRKMAARFPAWTAVIASRERIAQWSEMEHAVPEWRRRMRAFPGGSGKKPGGVYFWWQLGLLLVVIRGLFALFDSPSTPPQPGGFIPPRFEQPVVPLGAQEQSAEAAYERAAGRFYMPPGTRKLDPVALREMQAPRRAPPPGRFPNDAEMQAIFGRVDYRAPDAQPGTYTVKFYIELDGQGAIEKMTMRDPSGLPGFDLKAEEAIRASAPFGPEIRRNFELVFSWEHKARKKRAVEPGQAAPEAPE